MSGIISEIFDISLISGSAGAFRSAAGGYWYAVETDNGEVLSLEEGTAEEPLEPRISKVFLSDEVIEATNTMVPVRSRAVRLAASADLITSDQEWKTFFVGGAYGEIEYRRLYSDDNLDYFYFSYVFPYSQITASALASEVASDAIQITSKYNDYLPTYQHHIKNRRELLTPNYYMMADLSMHDFAQTPDAASLYPVELINYVSIEGSYENVNGLFDFNDSNLAEVPPTWALDNFCETRKRNTDLSIEYLPTALVQNELSASTIDWAMTRTKTLLFDRESIQNFKELRSYQECLPFKVKINFDTKPTGEFFDNIQQGGFSQRFLKTLYRTFSGLNNGLRVSEREYLKSNQYYSVDGTESQYVEDLENTSYREIDYMKFLGYCHNNYNEPIGDAIFVGPRNINMDAPRHINSAATMRCMNKAVRYMNNMDVTSWADLFSANASHSETLVYRIEKIGGAVSPGRNTQRVLQNYWFINSFDGKFDFCDNQVKYDVDYTYKVYAYVLIAGMRYGFSDLRLTSDIGCIGGPSNEWAGLEFYDPLTKNDERAPKIYDQIGKPGAPARFSYSIENTTYGSEAQLFSFFPYLADMKLNYQPTIKIVEIPIYTKTLRVLDAPPNRLNVVPYHTIDGAHRVGFDMAYNAFSSGKYPAVITNREQRQKEQFLNAKDLTEEGSIEIESVTNPTRIEIYRTERRPNLVSDFDGKLRATVSLSLEGEQIITKTNNFHEERIPANTKFYYLFRTVSQLGLSSHIGEIYEIELVNDGGYTYPLFNTIQEEELERKQFIRPTQSFKKVFQLQPNLGQIGLNTGDVDYSDTAGNQIGNVSVGTADELIWDKTFKIRMTSKKTGRKIDLNITYKLTEQ